MAGSGAEILPLMHAMQLDSPGERLHLVEREMPGPKPGEILIEISACGVCRTDLHVLDGDIAGILPIIPGHEVVGRIVQQPFWERFACILHWDFIMLPPGPRKMTKSMEMDEISLNSMYFS